MLRRRATRQRPVQDDPGPAGGDHGAPCQEEEVQQLRCPGTEQEGFRQRDEGENSDIGNKYRYRQGCESGSSRIRPFLEGSRARKFSPDPDPIGILAM